MTQHNMNTLKQATINCDIAKDTRILLVEDNRINQAVLLGVLNNIGLSADIAGNGLEALAALKNSPIEAPYKIVIMDCQMPEMDGYAATKAIRAGKAKQVHCNVPIIAMTANELEGDREKCLSVGMNDFTTKPVEAKVLYEKIAHWLNNDSIASSTDENSQLIDKKRNENNNKDIIWDKEGFLKRIRNNDKLAKQLITMFINDISPLKSSLISAIESKEFDDIIAHAHKITGSSKNLGGNNLASLTRQIEQLAKIKNITEILLVQKDLSSEFDLLMQSLQNFIFSTTTPEQN